MAQFEPTVKPPDVVFLTKREWFAGMALGGLLAAYGGKPSPGEYAVAAVRNADAMLELLAAAEPKAADPTGLTETEIRDYLVAHGGKL